MNNSFVNFTTTEESTYSTKFINLMDRLDICVSCINFLFGLPTHIYIVWLIVKGTKSAIASEFLILNLSVCEIGNCLNSLLSLFIYCTLFKSLEAFTDFLLVLSITGRPLFQCLICVERYLAVIHPVTFLKYKPLRYRVICSTAAWLNCLSFGLLYMVCLTFRDNFYKITFYLVQFLVFLSIQSFCCLAVLRALNQSGPGERGREREKENHMKRKAFYLILVTAVSMLFAYMPFTVAGFVDPRSI
ncbi:somatostatin receptor type 5-like [Triplophysa dalaica]|uniref:somatostatin receptor type 5-like n=1 Tax=Triplophysa dalaica TaxID=1582913 RepID=UPI0024E0289D|nr:somatostatin receptor type 5-like [Triplophysa dalaica]